ncbi:hypothetical protein HanIR_Chr03g0122151 [Helianthus annuus]|nr:hypothetical protein HanIR_Chr03g0122151 [Helianthus annuus]
MAAPQEHGPSHARRHQQGQTRDRGHQQGQNHDRVHQQGQNHCRMRLTWPYWNLIRWGIATTLARRE